MVVITSKEVIPPVQYVHSTLPTHEGITEQKKAFDSDLSINYAANIRNRSQERNNNGKNRIRIRNDQNYSRYQSGRYWGRKGRWNINIIPKCQICEKMGHTANKCYFRYDTNYNPS